MGEAATLGSALPEGWVAPWWLERARAGGDDGRQRVWTPVGALPAGPIGVVDPRGLVSPGRSTWSLDWWIGAEDRWHLPSREVGVRQRLVDATPVVETAMRVPGGDAVHRVYAIRASSRDGGGAVMIVEIENASAVPFAVALAVRPASPAGSARVERIVLDADGVVVVDGRRALLLARPPSRAAASDLAGGDSAETVFAGEAAEASVDVVCRGGRAQAAFLFPLAHRAAMRVAVPLDEGAVGFPAAVPGAARVAEGWAAQTRRGLDLDLPDARLAEAWQACRRFLLLLAGAEGTERARTARVLDRLGFHREAAESLRSAPVDEASLAALAEHWRLTRDQEVVRTLLPRLTRLLGSRRWARRASSGTLAAAADLLAAAGDPTAAADARRAAAARHDPVTRIAAPGPHRVTEALEERLADAGPTWTWPLPPGAGAGEQAAAAAELCELVRATVVQERDDGLALCPVLPPAWRGRSLGVDGAPTRFGPLSFAVRWHGPRPAVLWDLAAHPDLPRPFTLVAPGLDRTWRTTEPVGEALLGARP